MTGQTNTLKKMKSELIDVSFGLPLYMQEYWNFFQHLHGGNSVIKLRDNMPYTFGKTNLSLEHAIVDLHAHVGNAETVGYHVVVGNGASQVVSAAAYAAQKLHVNHILLEPPYWNRLKFLLNLGANAAGYTGNAVHKDKALITSPWFKFATSPNNPNGALQEPEGDLNVVDMCYAWPQYLKTVTKKSHDVMIFGLSKATGHAGTRIGWALVKNPAMADLMREYVHMSTCGVSTDAQCRATMIINAALAAKKLQTPDCFAFGKDKLDKRWREFLTAAAKCPEFKVLNFIGMFALCEHNMGSTNEYCIHQFKMNVFTQKVEDAYIPIESDYVVERLYGIKVLPASGIGLDNSSTCFRINLGCDDTTFEQLIKALSNGSKTTTT